MVELYDNLLDAFAMEAIQAQPPSTSDAMMFAGIEGRLQALCQPVQPR